MGALQVQRRGMSWRRAAGSGRRSAETTGRAGNVRDSQPWMIGVPMRRAVTLLLSLCCLIAASLVLDAGTADARSRAPRTELHPRTVTRGPNPRVAYYDRRSHRIHEGARSVAARFPGLLVQLGDVRGGWVMVNQEPDPAATTTFRFVNPRGRSRVLARESYANLDAVSADGRSIALSTAGALRTSVVRVADGRTATRAFDGGGRVVALGRVTALVSTGHGSVWWTPQTRRVSAYSADQAYDADTTAHRVALLRGNTSTTYVSSYPRGSRPPWLLPDGERVGRFSVDDRRVLTLGHRAAMPTGHSYSLLRTRSARRGVVRRSFLGRLDPVQDPRWETRTTFLALVRRGGVHHGSVQEAWLRCTVKGSCERASRVFELPAAGTRQSPLVLALQRTG